MERNEIIKDRLLLLADLLHYAPKSGGELLSALDETQAESFLALLEVLTDQAEKIFTAAQSSAAPVSGGFSLDGDGLICRECELLCRISWDDTGAAAGARCALGLKAADIAREQFGAQFDRSDPKKT